MGSWCLVVALLAINVWRLDNMIYRLVISWKTTCPSSQSKVLLQTPSGISSEIASKPMNISEKK
jgi:hypothetical protein